MKTVMMQLYEMLDEGKISDIAEIKEYMLVLEQKQIEEAYLEGYTRRAGGFPFEDNKYYIETYEK